MTTTRRSLMTMAAGVGVAGAMLAGCGSSNGTPAAAPVRTSTTAPIAGPVSPLSASAPTLTAQQVADPGLPSKVGPGKLSSQTLKRLMQFFEDKVSHAYATGNADSLAHYLAGPMLTGNRATINLLASKHRRNVFRIHVQSVKAESNDADRAIVRMVGDMTVNYFFDPATHKVLNNGLPGPSQLQFVVFLNRNPATGTWYWTGEKADTGGVNGADTVG